MLSFYTAIIFIVSLTTSFATSCSDNGATGTCMDVSACNGRTVSGLCPGASNIKCCIPTTPSLGSCSDNGVAGSCMDISACTGRTVSGLCPGASNIKCCITGGSSSGSSAELCGNYVGATVSSLAGNDDVIYSVVKILPAHLSDTSAYSKAPTESDNTMTTTTACAFDKMATAAKQAGVTIKINSGFRTIARQNYFWNCYQTKACNNGNLAARPGTSNHGRGIALDLNTDCGKQTGDKPNCGGSAVYQWLYNHAHTYGFIRTVQSEPWHWEFRGVGSARSSFT